MIWTIIIVVYISGLVAAGVYAYVDWYKKWDEQRIKEQELSYIESLKKIGKKFNKYPEGTKYEVTNSIEIVDLEENLRLLPGAVITVQKHSYLFTVVSFNISDNCARDVKIRTEDLAENCKKIESIT